MSNNSAFARQLSPDGNRVKSVGIVPLSQSYIKAQSCWILRKGQTIDCNWKLSWADLYSRSQHDSLGLHLCWMPLQRSQSCVLSASGWKTTASLTNVSPDSGRSTHITVGCISKSAYHTVHRRPLQPWNSDRASPFRLSNRWSVLMQKYLKSLQLWRLSELLSSCTVILS